VNNLQVTDYLLYNKNALNNLSFYFFDDFSIQPGQTSHIAAHLINFVDKSKFKKLDIEKSFDIGRATTMLREMPVKDVFGLLTKGYDSCIFSSKYMFSLPESLIPTDTTITVPPVYYPTVSGGSSETYTVNDERKGEIITPEIKFDNKTTNTDFNQRQKSMIIYVPDNIEAAKQRFVNFKNFITSKFKQIVETQTMDCYCDWLQFGYIYNLDQYHNIDYIYTPIAIYNVFYKDSNEKTAKHIARSIMLEYYIDPGNCGSCKFFKAPDDCTLHCQYTTENDTCYDYTT